MKWIEQCFAASLGLVFLASVPAAAVPSFTLTTLDNAFVRDELRVSDDGHAFLRNLDSGGAYFVSDMTSKGIGVGIRGGYSGDFKATEYIGSTKIRDIPFTTAQGQWSVAWDINENGDVLGGSTDGSDTTLQIFTSQGELLTIGGASYRRPSFNNRWEIVGAGYSSPAFFQDKTGRYELSSLVSNLDGFEILVPTDINDSGYIAGYGKTKGGQVTAFILSVSNPIPEPGTLSIFGAGIVLIALSHLKKNRSRS